MNILTGIENIIFDFGGVIFDIDPQLSVNAFKDLGIDKIGDTYTKLEKIDLFEKFETGKIKSEEFYDGIRKMAGKNLTNQELKDTWTSMLIRMPLENIRLLQTLKQKHRLFLLSNTNEIHCKHFEHIILKNHGVSLPDLFEKTYYSHLIGYRKPDKEIYQYVLRDSRLNASKTLFIDDSIKNIEGAEKSGIKGIHLEKGVTISDLFNNELLL